MKKKRTESISKFSMVIVTEIFIGLIASIASLVVFIKMAVNIQEIQEADVFVSSTLYSFRTPFVTELMIFLSYLGHEFLWGFFILGILLLLKFKKRHDAGVFSFILMSGGVMNVAIKEIIGRERPIVDPILQEILHSFPSLHAMNSFIFYSILVLFIYRTTRNRTYTLLSFFVCGSIVFLVGLSRIYLGAHYLSDVLAGYIIGIWWVATVFVIDKTVFLFLKRNESAT